MRMPVAELWIFLCFEETRGGNQRQLLLPDSNGVDILLSCPDFTVPVVNNDVLIPSKPAYRECEIWTDE